MGKLLKGIGNRSEIRNFYDNWSNKYDKSLNEWNYKAPRQAALILKKYSIGKPKFLLDLACGTGLFAQEIKKIYPTIICDGTDISKKIIENSVNIIDFDERKEKLIQDLYEEIENLKMRNDPDIIPDDLEVDDEP